MIDGMIFNFKKAVNRASEKSFTLNNSTSISQINLIGQNQQRVSIQDLHIDGLYMPKVSNVYVNSKNMKLHVVFNYKTIKVSGKCYSTSSNQQKLVSNNNNNPATNNKVLLEATNWNTSWSASIMQMIGRTHFDMSRVYTSHSQQRLSLNLKECPQVMHEKLKIAIIDKIKSHIEFRLNEIMETVMMQTETLSDDYVDGSSNLNLRSKPKERGKRASGAIGAATKQANLKTTTSSGAKKVKTNVTNNNNNNNPKTSPSPAVKAKPAQKRAAPSTSSVAKSNSRVSPKRSNPITSAPKVSKNQTSKKVADEKPKPAKQQQQQQQQSKTKIAVVEKQKKSQNSNNNTKNATISNNQSKNSSQKALKRNKRDTPCQPGEELDDYVDQLFRFGTRIVRAMEPVTTPNATIELPDYNLKIFLYDGKATRAYKFRRAKPAWVFCNNDTVSLGITIEVEELRVAYKYRVISGNRLLFDGDFEAKVSPRVQAQFSQKKQDEDSEDPVQQRVDRVRVFRLGRVHVVIRGLGNLTHSLSMMINSYLNDNQEELQPTFRMVEGDAVGFINRMLANVKVPLLSAV